jgi:AcrR family transcriptional regulator
VKKVAAAEGETRERLLEVAAQLFATRGFARVTVRDVCRAAQANVAAVNYHFKGKQGIYDAVIDGAITRMQATTDAIVEAGRGKTPSDRLRAYVSIFLQRVIESRDPWIHDLMIRELTDPTPALDRVVAEVLEPRMQYLAAVVAAHLGCPVDDPRVPRSVMSIQWQCLAAIDPRVPGQRRAGRSPADVTETIDHIVRFSIGGIESLAHARARAPHA